MGVLMDMIKKLAEKVDALDGKVNRGHAPTGDATSEAEVEEDPELATQDLRRRMDELLDIGATAKPTTVTKPVTTLTPYDEEDRRKGKALRSGRELRAENEVVVGVPWPHLRVYRFPEMKGADYDGLTVAEFMYGYVIQLNEASDPEVKSAMFKHLVILLEDAKDYPDDWPRIRAFHSLVLAYIERGLMSWKDKAQIMTMRQKYVFAPSRGRAITSGSSGSNTTKKITPCSDFNNGECSKRRDHDQMKHVCAYCYATFNRYHLHPKTECMKLHGQNKQITSSAKGAKTPPKQNDNTD